MNQDTNIPNFLIIVFTATNYESDHCFPERDFGWNQLLDVSMSLSPLYHSLKTELRVRTSTNFHQSFLWLRSAME